MSLVYDVVNEMKIRRAHDSLEEVYPFLAKLVLTGGANH